MCHLPPSQGVQATSANGEACSVFYLYGAAQAMAMLVRASSTAFDLRIMDLPSIGALVGFYHACLGFPVKQTWLEAFKAGNCNSFDGLTHLFQCFLILSGRRLNHLGTYGPATSECQVN